MELFRRRQIDGEVKGRRLIVENLQRLREESIEAMARLFGALQADPWENDAWQGELSPEGLLGDHWYKSPYVNIFEGGREGLRDMGDLFIRSGARPFPWAQTSYRSRVTLPDKVLAHGDPLPILKGLFSSLELKRGGSHPLVTLENFLGSGGCFLSMGARKEGGKAVTTFYLSGISTKDDESRVATRKWEVKGGIAEVLQPGAWFLAIGMLEIKFNALKGGYYTPWYFHYPVVQVVRRTSGEITTIVGGGPRIRVPGDKEKVWQLGRLPFHHNDMFDLIYSIIATSLVEAKRYYRKVEEGKGTLSWAW